uniref:Uncharacterized protein n=1 Tax=viral metagenome TaxID=1070528 RepID=A0A6H1ZHI4_9ZZZZ
MTRQELSNIRDLTFSQWIRNNLPDSSKGLMVSDLDFILQNYKTKVLMLLEIKTRNAELKTWQKSLFKKLSRWIKNGIDKDWNYLGFHIIKFENTFFNDGKCWLDNKVVSESELKDILSAFLE